MEGGGGGGGRGERCQDFLVKMGGWGGVIVIGGVYRRGISTALVGNVWILWQQCSLPIKSFIYVYFSFNSFSSI